MPSFGSGGCWLIASFARRGRFSNTGWTIAYEQPRFFSLEHRTLTTLRRSAQPIGANRVLAMNEPLAGLEATRTGFPSFPRRPDPVPAGAFPSPRSSWAGSPCSLCARKTGHKLGEYRMATLSPCSHCARKTSACTKSGTPTHGFSVLDKPPNNKPADVTRMIPRP
jgi:hypothetical protein